MQPLRVAHIVDEARQISLGIGEALVLLEPAVGFCLHNQSEYVIITALGRGGMMDNEQLNLAADALIRQQISLEFTLDGTTVDALESIADRLQGALLARLPIWHPSSVSQSDCSGISVRLERVTAYSNIGENPQPEVLAALRDCLPSGTRLVRGHGTTRIEPLASSH